MFVLVTLVTYDNNKGVTCLSVLITVINSVYCYGVTHVFNFFYKEETKKINIIINKKILYNV